MTSKTIQVNHLARVEGEGSLYIRVDGDTVQDVHLKIFEPPRFFEGLLRGRAFGDAVDITSRICGICPIAYQMSAAHAIESALGVAISPGVRALRRLLYCGEWIESHTLHIYMLHAPDFLGLANVVEVAREAPAVVSRGLALKKMGNRVVQVIGGREIHPINVRVGGFYRTPSIAEIRALRPGLEEALAHAQATLEWVMTLPLPELRREHELVALRGPGEYPMNAGRIVSTGGIDIAAAEYDEVFEELQVPHSTALHSNIRGRGAYLSGPSARLRHNADLLSPLAAEAYRRSGYAGLLDNPFATIIGRSIEVIYACEEALRIVDGYDAASAANATVTVGAGEGRAVTEAPRGILYHHYRIDDGGLLTHARISAPTSQNQKAIENDLRAYVQAHVHDTPESLQSMCERTIRNYDPCISCATHFLRIHWERMAQERAP